MAADSPKFVYAFGGGSADGNAGMKALLGGKGANLAEMANLGLPVPPGFTITTEVCTTYYANARCYPDGLADQVKDAIASIERITGAGFGDAVNPLLLSVRSGARASMPGMMDTVLNLGLNDTTAEGLAKADAIAALWEDVESELLGDFDGKDRKRLRKLLRRVARNLAEVTGADARGLDAADEDADEVDAPEPEPVAETA